ncbi:MAG TPA: cation:proton antiporter [Bdellovibrionota bacterium]|jgi:CPA2 family monovalent cation:H+ antiporter-2
MHQGSPLLSILYVFAAALVSASVLARIRQPNIIGYLIGGMLIGPFGLKLVPYENVELLAEIGIGLLMFTIGVELSLAQLMRVRNVAMFGGALIIVATTLLCLLLAPAFGWPLPEATVWGLVIGLSSTVVVLKLLADRGEVGSTHGNVATGILLFQDLLSIPILVLLPLLSMEGAASDQIREVLLTLARLGAFLAAVYMVGKFLVPPLLRFVAHTHNKELFSLSVLSITLAIAAITGKAGLSLALGAFLAGLIVSESDFGHQAATEVLPLKDSFSAVFFVSVGMLLNFNTFLEKWPTFTLWVALIMGAKFFIVLATCFAFRYPNKISVFTALALAQISEFGFLVLVAAKKIHIVSDDSYQRLLGISILSIIATPYLLKANPRIKKAFAFMNKSKWVVRELELTKPVTELQAGAANEMEKHVILCGYGPTGAIVAKKLQSVGVPVVIVDLNYKQIQALKASKQHAVYGDSASTIVLEGAGLGNAALLVVTIPDPQAMRALVRKVKNIRSDLPLVMRVRYMKDRDDLVSLGADEVVWEEQEAGEELANRALQKLEIGPT